MSLGELLFLLLTPCVCGVTELTVAPSVYEAQENGSVSLEWRFPSAAVPLDICCDHTRSQTTRLLFLQFNDIEAQSFQDELFRGRVWVERAALSEGLLRIHVSALSSEDSGLYSCIIYTGLERYTGDCLLSVSAAPGRTQEQTEQPPGGALTVSRQRTGLYAGLGLLGVLGLFALALRVRSIFCAAPPTNQGDMV